MGRLAASRTVIRVGDLSFYLIPKNANSSIRYAVLRGVGYDDATAKEHHHRALNLSPVRNYPGTFRVCFFRHPLARLVSCWADKMHHRMKSTRGFERLGYRLGMSFSDFVEVAKTAFPYNAHTRRQVDFISVGMDFWGIIERLGEDWGRLREFVGWLPPLALTLNAGPPRPHWSSYYDAQTRKVVSEIYAPDLEIWHKIACGGHNEKDGSYFGASRR